VLDDLERTGLVDDREYARAYCREAMGGSNPAGPVRLRAALLRRGIADALLDEVLSEALDEQEEDLLSLAMTAGARKMRLVPAGDEPRKKWGKLCRFLAGRGFPADVCREAAARLLDGED
jgi:SOS response regulatory protein OraA/RecX